MLSSDTGAAAGQSSDSRKQSREPGKRVNVRKLLGFILKPAAVVLLFMGIVWALNYLVFPAKAYTRIQFHDLYTTYGKKGKNIDLLFLGTSHAYRSFDPAIFDEALGVDSYNFGTSMQTISTSYYILKEVLKTNHPQQVVFELTYSCFNEKEHLPLKSVIVSQYMRPSVNKLDYLLHEYEFEDIFYGLIPAYCFRENMEPETLAENLKNKSTAAFKNYHPSITKSETEWMESKGFVYTDKELSIYHMGKRKPEAWDESQLSSKYLDYLDRIIALCKEENVELIFVTAPSPEATLLELGNYDAVCRYLDALAEKNNITYYNFNLVLPEIMKLTNFDFYDSHHVNGEGGRKVSTVLAEILDESRRGEYEAERYFFSSWEEKKQSIDYITHTFYNVEVTADHYILTARAFSGQENAEYEYSYWVYNSLKESENELLRDWSTDPTFSLPKDFRKDSYRIRVAARLVGSEQSLATTQRQIRTFPIEKSDE